MVCIKRLERAKWSNCSQSSEPSNRSKSLTIGQAFRAGIYIINILINKYQCLLSQLFANSYGFVTFETEEDANKVMKESDNLLLKNKKLNVSVAIRKNIPNGSMPLLIPF